MMWNTSPTVFCRLSSQYQSGPLCSSFHWQSYVGLSASPCIVACLFFSFQCAFLINVSLFCCIALYKNQLHTRKVSQGRASSCEVIVEVTRFWKADFSLLKALGKSCISTINHVGSRIKNSNIKRTATFSNEFSLLIFSYFILQYR